MTRATMGSILFLFLCIFQAQTDDSQAFVTQSARNLDKIRIRTNFMFETCFEKDANLVPVIDNFTFRHWTTGCTVTATKENMATLFNAVLATLKSCVHEYCSDINVPMPILTCRANSILPDTVDIQFDCEDKWQDILTTTSLSPLISTSTASPVIVTQLTVSPPTTTKKTTMQLPLKPTEAATNPSVTLRASAPILTIQPTGQAEASNWFSTYTAQLPRQTSSTITTATQLQTLSLVPAISERVTASPLEAVKTILARPIAPGWLGLNKTEFTCKSLDQVRVNEARNLISEEQVCATNPINANYQEWLQSPKTLVLIGQGYCDSSHIIEAIRIFYTCQGDESAATTEVAGNERQTSHSQASLAIALGVALPLAAIIILVIVIVMLRRRRKEAEKALLNSAEYATYQDPATFLPDNRRSVIDAYEVYQDPAQIHGQGQLNQAFTDSPDDIYTDPEHMRRQRTSVHSEPESNPYADIEGDRQPPEGMAANHLYDMPTGERDSMKHHRERPRVAPRGQLNTPTPHDPKRISAEAYAAMVKDKENHEYAVIRKSRPVTADNLYFELENDVTLYTSPVYESADDDTPTPVRKQQK